MIASALVLGFAAGLRTMTPAAMLALRRDRPLLGGVLGLFAVSEMAFDKLPLVPPRTSLAPSLARAAMGACVAAAAARKGSSRVAAALAGTAGAVAGTQVGFAARRAASGWAPAGIVALGEDVIAVTLAAWGTRAR